MTPTERRRETARELLRLIRHPYVVCSDEVALSSLYSSLAKAEREGMKRAAEIARFYPYTEIFSYHKNSAVACNASQNIADMIEGRLDATPLSEAGEG